jgi:hypothetical protein
MTVNDKAFSNSSDLLRRRRTCFAERSTIPSSKGGLHSKDPSDGKKAKNEPTDPKIVSVSGKRLQYWCKRQFKGEAKHSASTFKPNRRISKTAP